MNAVRSYAPCSTFRRGSSDPRQLGTCPTQLVVLFCPGRLVCLLHQEWEKTTVCSGLLLDSPDQTTRWSLAARMLLALVAAGCLLVAWNHSTPVPPGFILEITHTRHALCLRPANRSAQGKGR